MPETITPPAQPEQLAIDPSIPDESMEGTVDSHYLDGWHDIYLDHPELEAELRSLDKRLQKAHADVFDNRRQSASYITEVRQIDRYYHLIPQDSELTGAEADLANAKDIILQPIHEGITSTNADQAVLAVSILVDLYHSTDDDRRFGYAEEAKAVAESILSAESIPWSNDAKISAAMFKADMDLEQIREFGKRTGKNTYELCERAMRANIANFVPAARETLAMPQGTQTQEELKSSQLGIIWEWAALIEYAHSSIDNDTFDTHSLVNATLRQDQGKKIEGALNRNFDAVLQTPEGKRHIQLKMGETTDAYIPEIAEVGNDWGFLFPEVVDGVESLRKVYAPIEFAERTIISAQDKTQIKNLQRAFDKVHAVQPL